MRLDRVLGPDCPCCGCKDGATLRRYQRGGKVREQRSCRHCAHVWTATLDEPVTDEQPAEPEQDRGVVYHVVVCPACGSKKTHVTSTRRPIRLHKCRDCGHTFKSVEK